ncbi:MAG: porin [Aquabacterium sp.]|nr:porin [Aquabacterium sp.]
MKKSLIVLAVLGAFAGVASAQSSVTLYGRVDLSINKPTGSANKNMSNGSGSRFGVRGVEDLGGGLSAFFNLEHRYDADTGAQQGAVSTTRNCVTTAGAIVANQTAGQANTFAACPAGSTANAVTGQANRFWTGRSIVGLQGGFGKITLGREYTTAFLMSQLAADPWGWDTVVSGTPSGGLNQLITGGAIARVRNDSSLTYNFSASGFSVGAQIAEATDTINLFSKKPFNFAVGYAAGPVAVTLGYEKTGQVAADTAKWMTINGSFNLGAVKLGGLYGTGNTAAGADHRSMLFTAVAPMGQGEFRASYGVLTNKTTDVDAAKGFAVGYHYALSKRTTVYADFLRNTAVATQKTGYDFGIKHNF